MGKKLYWEYTALAIPAFVDPMLDDIGVDNPIVRQAARSFALAHLRETRGVLGSMTMSDLQHELTYFIEGYEQALKASGGEHKWPNTPEAK